MTRDYLLLGLDFPVFAELLFITHYKQQPKNKLKKPRK